MSQNTEARRRRLSLLAKAPHDRLIALWSDWNQTPAHGFLRPPEIGAVMVRGRAGATGAPFNLGEMTVTRCSVELAGSGTVGHGYVQGRSKEAAKIAALADAIAEDGQAEAVETALIGPLAAEAEAKAAARAAKAAATKVEFFTMVRGDNA
ncbi:MAG: phosphonate C-P lyase system protein PhnG [Pseudomonadota bacterium]